MSDDTNRYIPPDWAFEFHGHVCPFMPLGYRMGVLALQRLGIEREKDHTMHAFLEIGEGHPQMCLGDGVQVATGATFAKGLMEKTYWGKLAATFWYPGKVPVRFVLKASFLEKFGGFEFFALRKQGIEPSQILSTVTQEVIDWTLAQPDEAIFAVSERPDFHYQPPKGSFNKAVCSVCGEVVFERYVRTKDGKPACIPCSGYKG
jgi:formylmethanofuran dehydrogenase subunit E